MSKLLPGTYRHNTHLPEYLVVLENGEHWTSYPSVYGVSIWWELDPCFAGLSATPVVDPEDLGTLLGLWATGIFLRRRK